MHFQKISLMQTELQETSYGIGEDDIHVSTSYLFIIWFERVKESYKHPSGMEFWLVPRSMATK